MITDYFTYSVAVAQLRSCKYNKDIEQLARKYREYTSQAINSYPNPVVYEHIKYNYKLLALAVSLYTAKSKARLVNNVYDIRINTQRYITSNLPTNNRNGFAPLANCTEVIDIFEFDTIVETQAYGSDYITPLHSVIKGTPLHFKFKFNQLLTRFDMHSTAHLDNSLRLHLYALRLKQTLSPGEPSTVLDQYVSDTYAAITQHENIATQILLLQQHTSALQEYQNGQLQRLPDRLNGEPV